MPDPTSTDPGAPEKAAPASDWAADVAGRVEALVGSVRERTSDRLVSFARILVFGLVAAVMAIMALIIAVIAGIRILDVILPGEVWLPYLVLGAIFLAAGAFFWSKRSASPASS